VKEKKRKKEKKEKKKDEDKIEETNEEKSKAKKPKKKRKKEDENDINKKSLETVNGQTLVVPEYIENSKIQDKGKKSDIEMSELSTEASVPIKLDKSEMEVDNNKYKKDKHERKENKRFQLIDVETVKLDPTFQDNSFDAKKSINNANGDQYGKKANEILGKVRGKDFRHEKTKKKRVYNGLGLDKNAINSFKFAE